jgi:aminoglycoside 9-adenylyltransferase
MGLTAATGEIASKDVAVEWAKGQLAKEHAALLDYAKQGYLGNIEDR